MIFEDARKVISDLFENEKDPIHLEFRGSDGLTQEVPIVAARATETDEGDMLLLWVRLSEQDLVVDFVFEDDEDEYDDYDDDYDEDEDDEDY